MKKAVIFFMLFYAVPFLVPGQVEPEETKMRGWYAGAESLRLINSALYTLSADDDLIYKELYDIEAIFYYQGRGFWRPVIRTGYVWLRDNSMWDSNQPKKVISRGTYVKAGTDFLISRKKNKNHALGIHGVLAYGNEDFTFRAGNPYFGYKEAFYEQEKWAKAVELRYAYTRLLSKKINCQLGTYVSVFDRDSNELKAYRNIPGINYSLGVFLHILYKVH